MNEIKTAIAALTPELKIEHDKCIAEGLKDEICPKCKKVFLAHHHFVRCEEKPCPMSNGKTFIDMWEETIKKKEENEMNEDWEKKLKAESFLALDEDKKATHICIELKKAIPFIKSLLKDQLELIAKMAEKDINNEWFANRIRNYAPEPSGEPDFNNDNKEDYFADDYTVPEDEDHSPPSGVMKEIKFSKEEIIILKEILKTAKHSYTRNFRCKACGHIYELAFSLHNANTKNNFGDQVCKNCGNNKKWEDVKIKTITIDIRKVKQLRIIESDE